MVKVAFYYGNKGFYETLVCIFAGKPTHCELVFPSDGQCFSASSRDGGTRFKRINLDFDHWKIIRVPGVNERKVRAFCESVEGRPYDYLGAILGRFGWQAKRKYFCNEVVLSALIAGGIVTSKQPHKLVPSALFRWLTQERNSIKNEVLAKAARS